MKNMEKENRKLEQQILVLHRELDDINEKFEELDEKRLKLEQRVEDLEGENEGLEQRIEDMKGRY